MRFFWSINKNDYDLRLRTSLFQSLNSMLESALTYAAKTTHHLRC